MDLGFYEQDNFKTMNETDLAPGLRGLFHRWAVTEKGLSQKETRSLHAVEAMAAEPAGMDQWYTALKRLIGGLGQQRFAELLASPRCPLPLDQRLALMALVGTFDRHCGPVSAALGGGKAYPALTSSKDFLRLPVVKRCLRNWASALQKQGRLSPRTACYVRNFYRQARIISRNAVLEDAMAVNEPDWNDGFLN